MDHAAIDLGKFHSQIAVITESGKLIEKRIRTERSRLEAMFGGVPRMRILLEASTESEWVARCLESLGHQVVVGDPNYAPMYGQRSRRVKTDRRDARALVEACRLGVYRPAYRGGDEQHERRGVLLARDGLVRARTRLIGLCESLLRREGLRVGGGGSGCFPRRVEELELGEALARAVSPLLRTIAQLSQEIAALTKQIRQAAEQDELTRRLMSVPRVGPLTASSFIATVGEVKRFRGAHQLEAYLGVVPSEMSSGEKQHRGRITKVGNSRMRCLLVEAAWGILLDRKPDTAALRSWAQRIAARRGRSVAAIALARRVAGILYALWRDGTVYQAERLGPCPGGVVAA